jgi:hypothetical protein
MWSTSMAPIRRSPTGTIRCHVREDRIALAASGFLEVFKKMWPEAWGVRMEHILRNVLMALLEQPDATMHDILRVLSDREYRKEITKTLKNETVRAFFQREFERFTFGYRADGIAPIQNKVGAFLADPLLNRILTSSDSEVRVRSIMDEGRILLVNLAKGQLGEDSSSLLGGLMVTTIGLAAFSRADTPAEQRRNFYVYVDEFQTFTTLAVTNMLSELRKYRVGFTIAYQYLHQLDAPVRHAVLGNVGSAVLRPRVRRRIRGDRPHAASQPPHLRQAHDRQRPVNAIQRHDD